MKSRGQKVDIVPIFKRRRAWICRCWPLVHLLSLCTFCTFYSLTNAVFMFCISLRIQRGQLWHSMQLIVCENLVRHTIFVLLFSMPVVSISANRGALTDNENKSTHHVTRCTEGSTVQYNTLKYARYSFEKYSQSIF